MSEQPSVTLHWIITMRLDRIAGGVDRNSRAAVGSPQARPGLRKTATPTTPKIPFPSVNSTGKRPLPLIDILSDHNIPTRGQAVQHRQHQTHANATTDRGVTWKSVEVVCIFRSNNSRNRRTFCLLLRPYRLCPECPPRAS